jgi:hypothetical protein
MIINGHPNPNNSSSADDDIDDDTYIASPQAHPHEKGLASASGSGAATNEEIEEEVEEEDDRRAAAPRASPHRATRGKGQPRDKPPSPIWKFFSLLFGMCKSQHVTDVKAHHERRERKKITKSMKEICAHLNLQPPSSLIASEGEESLKIESFKERIARFDEETLVQQWYNDGNFSGFGFDYGGMTRASSSHPPPFDFPPLVNPQNVEESKDEDGDD